MDWTDVGDVAALVSVVVVAVGLVSWLVRRMAKSAKAWITEQVRSAVADVSKHLTNGETSVAVYAHQARDAAVDAKEAALDARTAALQASDAAHHAAEASQKIALAVSQLTEKRSE